VRIRIALSTAMAVIVSAAAFLTLLNSPPAASARATHQRHHASGPSKSQLAFFAVPKSVPTAQGPTLALGGPPATAATTPAPAPVAAPAPAPVVVPPNDSNSVYTGDWMCIRIHESGNRYNDPAEPSGAYGILISTWRSFGLSGWPYEASAGQQDQVALELYARYGFRPWSSRFACGL
jgi:hypothetical protein